MTPIARIILLSSSFLPPSSGWKTPEFPDRPSSSLSILSTSNIQGYVLRLEERLLTQRLNPEE
jgi:hypothetical protein